MSELRGHRAGQRDAHGGALRGGGRCSADVDYAAALKLRIKDLDGKVLFEKMLPS